MGRGSISWNEKTRSLKAGDSLGLEFERSRGCPWEIYFLVSLCPRSEEKPRTGKVIRFQDFCRTHRAQSKAEDSVAMPGDGCPTR
jgi:hypothetical protein